MYSSLSIRLIFFISINKSTSIFSIVARFFSLETREETDGLNIIVFVFNSTNFSASALYGLR